jgi:hypothetical protein
MKGIAMKDRLETRFVDVIDSDVVVKLPGNGTVLVRYEDLMKLASEKGLPLPDADQDG